MRLTHIRNRFELTEFSNEEGKTAAKRGLRLDGRRFLYFTHSPEISSLYLEYSSDQKIGELVRRHQATILFSRATNFTGLTFPCPKNQNYLPFQTIGIAYALQRQHTLIGDEPGLGKTIQAAGIMNADDSLNNILIVCPAILRINWVRELQKWFLRCESIDIAYSPSEAHFPRGKIIITNYDILEKLRPEIDKRVWDLVIFDESQYLKNGSALRTIAAFGNAKQPRINASKTLFLSGTPLVNRPEDLWTLIKQADPNDLGANWDYYGKRYCQLWRAPWGWDSSGAAHLEELQNRLRGTFMIRRRKRDVLADYTPKRRQIVIIQAKGTMQELLAKEKIAYDKAKNKLELTIEAAQAAITAVEQEGNWESYKKIAKKLTVKMEEEFSELSRMRHEVAVAKIPYNIEYIQLMLNEHQKIVVFAHHTDVIQGLKKAFENRIDTVSIFGDDEFDRQKSIDRFQENPSCRLAIVGITVCLGFHLTAASYGLAVELDWRPTVMTQAEDRLDRIGQKNPVLIQHLCFAESTDVLQVRKIIEKQEIIDKAIG